MKLRKDESENRPKRNEKEQNRVEEKNIWENIFFEMKRQKEQERLSDQYRATISMFFCSRIIKPQLLFFWRI